MGYNTKEKTNAFFRKRYRENVKWVAEYKVGKGCVDCGYNKHPMALEFDHVEPRLRGTVSSQMGKSLNVIQQEIARCELVCSNCHSLRTWRRARLTEGWSSGIVESLGYE